MSVHQVVIFDKNKSVSLRGVAALCVMLGHITSLYPWYIQRLFPGELCVGLFFFFSGYGLYKSYSERGQSYLTGFWWKKFRTIYLPFLYAETFMTLSVLIVNSNISFTELVLGATGIHLYNSALWYIIELLIINFLFWCFAKFFKLSQRAELVRVWILAYICFLTLGVLTGIGTWWYISSSGFLLGALACNKEHIIKKIISNNWSFHVCFLFIIIYLLSLYLSKCGESVFNLPTNYILTAITMILVPLFIYTCAVLFQHVKKVGGVFHYLGIMSLEIYLWHIPVFYLVKIITSDRLMIILLTVFITIIISALFRYKDLKHQLIKKNV